MRLLYGTEEAIKLNMSNLLTQEGIDYTDIVEAVFMLKNKATDPDEDALMTLTLGNGLEWNDDNTALLGTVGEADWDNLPSGTKLLSGFGFKLVDSVRYIEVKLSDSSVQIAQDFIRG